MSRTNLPADVPWRAEEHFSETVWSAGYWWVNRNGESGEPYDFYGDELRYLDVKCSDMPHLQIEEKRALQKLEQWGDMALIQVRWDRDTDTFEPLGWASLARTVREGERRGRSRFRSYRTIWLAQEKLQPLRMLP